MYVILGFSATFRVFNKNCVFFQLTVTPYPLHLGDISVQSHRLVGHFLNDP